jgi:methyl-accepting chemotaxis protein
MEKKITRKPIANFFIKKDLQVRLIIKIVLAVVISTLVCMATLLLVYLAQYKSTVFYRVTFDLGASIGNRENIVTIIFPSLCIASVINVFVALCIGFYASRKYAVPIFKLEQWVKLLRRGKLTAKLRFREREEMRELSGSCNKLSEELQAKFVEIENAVSMLKENPSQNGAFDKIKNILDALEYKTETIEVHTSYLNTEHLGLDKD